MTSQEEILLRMGFNAEAVQRGTAAMMSAQRSASADFSSIWSKAAGLFTIGTMGMALRSVLNRVGEIRNEASQTGFDTDRIQRFNFQLQHMNIEVQSGKVGLGKMNELIGQAAEGEEKAVQIFARWGISTTGKSNGEIFDEIKNKIAGMVDPAQRVAMAMEIFGRGGRELLPLLTASNAELDKIANRAPIISKEDLDVLQKSKNFWGEIWNYVMLISAKLAVGPITPAIRAWNRATDSMSGTERDEITRHQEDLRRQQEDAKKHAAGPGTISPFMRRGWKAGEPTPQEGKQLIYEALYGMLTQGMTVPKDMTAKNAEATRLNVRITQNERELDQREREYPTMENLAGRGYTARLNRQYGRGGRFDLGRGNGPLGATARDYELAQKQQVWDLTYGNRDMAEKDRARMIADRDKLIGAGVAKPELQWEKMRENTDAMSARLDELVKGGAVIKTKIVDE
jgi:hypothetical protein